MPPLTESSILAPPSPRVLVSSFLRQLSSLQDPSTSGSHAQQGTNLRGDEDDHISDSEASDTSSSASAEADEPPNNDNEVKSTSTASASRNPLTPFLKHPALKPLFATLHALFPHYLLPALDVLDRKLITRLVVVSDGAEGEPEGESEQCRSAVYYVRSLGSLKLPSTASATAMVKATDAAQLYEVRLTPWHCSCAAFAFGAAESDGLREEEWTGEEGWHVFGGSYRAKTPPVCKHLLACLLAESWAPLRVCVEERRVSVDEMAGWAAGWV